jgi:sugar lactone lactonase YvrE
VTPRRLAGVAAALALAGGSAGYPLLAAAQSPSPPIIGTAPSYGPKTVSAVPNAAAIVRRIWLPELDAGYDPQGLAVDRGGVYVSAYRSDGIEAHRGPCRVFRIDPDSGRESGHFDVPSPCGHAGGLALGGDGILYIADTHTVFATRLADAFGPGGPLFRQFPLGTGLVGALAVSTADGIWLGTYDENAPGRLFRFSAGALAALHDGEMLDAAQAASVLTIPDYAQGAAAGGGALWVARSGVRWATLDRLDPMTGVPQRRYDIVPGTEGLAFDDAGRLWAVSEAGARHYYDRPFAGLVEPFFPLVFALDLSRLE